MVGPTISIIAMEGPSSGIISNLMTTTLGGATIGIISEIINNITTINGGPPVVLVL